MSFRILNDLRVIIQGFTGKSGTYHSNISMKYGTNIVGGVTPGKGKSIHLGKPVFNTVKQAILETNANASIIFVPAKCCRDSILEAILAGIKLIVCVTEGIPILDMLYIKRIVKENNVTFIGPNCPGFVVPGIDRLGIMPADIHKSGVVGIVSRSGTLTYEAIKQTTHFGLGQSISIGIGGYPIVGSNFVDVLNFLEDDFNTKVILLIGEIGGAAEEKASEFISKNVKKPVFAYISGLHSPIGKRMGHAGAIISETSGDPKKKIRELEKNNVFIIKSLSNIGSSIYNNF